MKANELMIGDWLWYRGQFNAFPFKVEQITKQKVGYHAEPKETRLHYLRLHEIEPIPLTIDILEKNGMELEDNNCGFFKEDEGYDLELLVENGHIWWSINYAEYTLIPLNFVHQLQNAIRLCCIDKEIIL